MHQTVEPYLPAKRGNSRYFFGKLEVGANMLVDDTSVRVRVAAAMWAKRHPGIKFKINKIGTAGLLVERIA